ncbi:short chain dehydrogenase [Pseudomonas sp. ZT5P21]
MINSLTGMKPGERYAVENLGSARSFPGFFLDGKYYLKPELMTAVGWLEGQHFLYDELDRAGKPVFPDRVAGIIDDLTLILVDGARLKLNKVRYSAPVDLPTSELQHPRAGKYRPSLLVALASTLLLGGSLFARQKRRDR